MNDRIFTTELYPYVEKAFSKPETVKEYESIIGKYIDRNSEQLSAIGPMENIMFTDNDRNAIFQLIGITESDVKKMRQKSTARKTKDNLVEAPFSTLMATVIRYFDIGSSSNAQFAKLKEMSIFYLAMFMYPFLYKRSFPYPPIKNIMVYTINNLSEKYIIKQLGHLMSAIIATSTGAYNLHQKGIVKGDDVSYNDFVYALRTRLFSFIKNIAKEFYINHKAGNYLNTDEEINDGETYREADSSMYLISRKVDDISLRLIVDGPPMKLISLAAKSNKISINELRNYVTTMVTNEYKDEIKDIIESILILYLFDDKNSVTDINSDKFLLYCLDIYKKANTTNTSIVKIKGILDKWLDRLNIYKKTQRAATINNFRRALFTFFIMCIMHYNK